MVKAPTSSGPTIRVLRAGMLAAVTVMAGTCGGRADEAFRPAIAVTPEGLTCVLGGGLEGQLVDSTVITPLMTHKQEYALVTLEGIRDIAWSIGRPLEEEIEGGCVGTFQQELSIGPAQTGNYMVAVLGSRQEVGDLLPKKLDLLPQESAEYAKVLREYLKSAGIVEPKIAIRQLVAADLDGDGESEILINAVNTARETMRKDEYSVLLVRKRTAGVVQVLEIASEIMVENSDEPSPLWENTIAGIVDLDGDGTMEIVLYGAYLHGDGWQVVRLNRGEVDQVLDCGCGG